MGLFGNETHTFRRPRVKYGTLRQHFRTFSSPESAARHAWVNFRAFSLPKGARQNDVRIRGTLRQRNPYFSSPKSKIRYAWVTLPRIFVARECSAARLGDTSAHFRRPRVQHDTLEQHCRAFSSLKGAARYSSATKSTLSVVWGGWATSILCRRGWSCRRGSTGERGLRSGHPR